MIVVLADDLSGAAELAGVALRHGLSAELQTAFSPATDAEVVCVATDTRSLPAAQAAATVAQVTGRIVAAQPAWIFKKCDSVLRGPVLAEIRAMAEAAGKSRSLLLPANPSRGRIIQNGTYFINGQLLQETAFAHDPEHPRSASRVTELLGGALAGVETPDAQTADDMLRHAATVDALALPVGAADFFEALLRLRVPARPAVPSPARVPPRSTLLVCGSVAAWAERRREAAALELPLFTLPHDATDIATAMMNSPLTLVGIGDGSATLGQTPVILVSQLARTVAEILRTTTVDRLLLEGGATAAAVMQAVGWTRFRACDVSVQGLGAFLPVNASGPRLTIKPGSYAWPAEVWPNRNSTQA